jgi:hypothetical protein
MSVGRDNLPRMNINAVATPGLNEDLPGAEEHLLEKRIGEVLRP